ncbi:FeoB-associated Cys-rich membrane protein [uncultured Helicobacter sp.]|nr:FeoB-associated Cys-rich membrane protein [uncultured Helicobacter sp.]
MEAFILGIILVGALLYFGYKLYPKKDKGCGCGCGGGSSKNPRKPQDNP